MTVHPMPAEHEKAYKDFYRVIEKHMDIIDEVDMLAIISVIVGEIVALQNPHTVTPEIAMLIARENIEIGNKQMLEANPALGRIAN